MRGQLQADGKDVFHEEDVNIVVINTRGFIDNAQEESVTTILEFVGVKKRAS
ncbi:MAG: ribosomal protein S12 methylthiotransferase [Roseivirga sp.]